MAIISLPTSFSQGVQQVMSDLITSLGRSCTIYYPPIQSGCNNCFDGDSIVISEFGPKKIKDIMAGEKVYNNNGLRIVEDTYTALYHGPMYNLRCWGINDNSWCTEDHKFEVIKNFKQGLDNNKFYKLDFLNYDFIKEKVQAKYLEVGDAVILGNNYLFSQKELDFIEDSFFGKVPVDHDLLFWMGWWLAEGCLIKDRSINFCLNLNKEQFIAEELIRIGKSKFNVNGKIEHRNKHNSIYVHFNSVKLHKFMLQFGKLAHNKHLPYILFNTLSINQLSTLFKYYHMGDGHIRPKERGFEKSIITVSYKLAHQVFIFLSKIGILPSISYNKARVDKYANHKECWKVSWFDNHVNKPSGRFNTKYGLVSIIRKIDKKLNTCQIYNLSVENEHNFICNNILVENCLPNPIGGKSSNIYADGGATPFFAGQICPECNGNFFMAIEDSENISLTVNWNPDRWDANFPAAYRYAESIVQVRGYVSDLQKINNAEFIEIFSEDGLYRYRFKLAGEPVLPDQFTDGVFFNAYLDRA